MEGKSDLARAGEEAWRAPAEASLGVVAIGLRVRLEEVVKAARGEENGDGEKEERRDERSVEGGL